MPVSPARAAAFDILLKIEREDAYASELLHAPQQAGLSSVDHRLATELVMGVLRWRSALDTLIAAQSSQRLAKLDLEVITALRLASYQMKFLERVPHRAAVHESVELVKRARKRSAVPFVNAVLRKLVDGLVKLDSDSVTPDANTTQLAQHYAHPVWLVERWAAEFGIDAARQVCKQDQRTPETAIRLIRPEVEEEFKGDSVTLSPGLLLTSARRVEAGDVTQTRTFREGRIVIQDEASQLVALLVGQGKSILDCCAAPGGKTRLIAQHSPEATVVAVELHPHRARLLQRLVRETNTQVLCADARQLPLAASFDRVLADVPCSGTGTLGRNPEIKWRLKPEDLAELRIRQVEILRAAMRYVTPGGRIIYATCSLEREENSEVVKTALKTDLTFRLVDARQELERLQAEGQLAWPDLDSLLSEAYLRTIPGVHPCDGFFAAILERE